MSFDERMTAEDLAYIASCGGGMTVSAGRRSSQELGHIASCGKRHGATLRILQSDRLTREEAGYVASCSPGNVVFD